MLTTRPFLATLDQMQSLNRAFDRAFTSSWDGTTNRVWMPALDVTERKDAYIVTIDLPGVDPAKVDVSFEQNVLTVRGSKTSAATSNTENDGVRVYANERTTGAFERAIRLPEFVDGEHITATSTNGVLEITVPKATMAQPRKIEIRNMPVAA
jgi:HSP20 family protein